MPTVTRRGLLASLAALPAAARRSDDWIPLFDGKSLAGWKASDAGSFRVTDGAIAADGPRSHLFYDGGVNHADFKNFELKAEVMTRPGSNSGIYFHTRFQPRDWPEQGFEVQVNNTHRGEGKYRERKKTGSLYGIRSVYKAFARDDEWFELHIAVRGKQVQTRLNGTLLVDYVEPDPPVQVKGIPGRTLGRGTFALQCHDANSKVFFRNILVKPLPDDLPAPASGKPVVDDLYREILDRQAHNFPVVDYHVHLKGGLTLEEALHNSRRLGIQYGIAVNCGLGFGITDDAGARGFLESMKGQPAFVAMQAEGREWVKMFSKEVREAFDYVFTDAMTFTDDNGKRMRLWIKEDVGRIDDRQRFMDMCVDRILGVLNREPIDIYVNATFLPEAISAAYDELWTPERMERVVEAAARNNVAIEINSRYRIPSAAFIRLARKAGVKFSMGTNNGDRNLGRLEYSLQMARECGLASEDMFIPRAQRV